MPDNIDHLSARLDRLAQTVDILQTQINSNAGGMTQIERSIVTETEKRLRSEIETHSISLRGLTTEVADLRKRLSVAPTPASISDAVRKATNTMAEITADAVIEEGERIREDIDGKMRPVVKMARDAQEQAGAQRLIAKNYLVNSCLRFCS